MNKNMRTQVIRKKINAAKKTKKLTKALENIATIKMNKFLRSMQQVRVYQELLRKDLGLFSNEELANSDFVQQSTSKQKDKPRKNLIILISSDRGLCGSYNLKVFKEFLKFSKEKEFNKEMTDIICVGKKGAFFAVKTGFSLKALYLNSDRENSLEIAKQLKDYIAEKYLEAEYQKVHTVYTEYESGITQTPKIKQLLPLDKSSDNAKEEESETYKLIEEDKKELLNHLIGDLVETNIAKFLLESITSENIARANSMKNATDSAEGLIDDLTLVYNKSRQAAVTQEIMEISNSAQVIV